METSIERLAQIAIVCHEANRAWCDLNGDPSQLPWNEAEQWQRDSAVSGVRYALDNPDAPPSAQHEAWLADKEADGWKYGAVKDAEAKTHPCFLPYDELPEVERRKDALFQAIVKALAPVR
jgi:hypothetical protein